jgi:hypothetical protein
MRTLPEVLGRWALLAAFAAATLVSGCANLVDSESARTALSTRQRDSTLAESALPGAATVGRALERSDDALVRSAALDSLTH